MSALNGARNMPVIGRAIIAVVLILFIILQGWELLGPDGILSHYNFFEGFSVFGNRMLADPETRAGLIDMVTLEVFMVVVLANGIPRGPAYPVLLIGGVLISFVYPGLTALGFLLLYWRRLGQFRP